MPQQRRLSITRGASFSSKWSTGHFYGWQRQKWYSPSKRWVLMEYRVYHGTGRLVTFKRRGKKVKGSNGPNPDRLGAEIPLVAIELEWGSDPTMVSCDGNCQVAPSWAFISTLCSIHFQIIQLITNFCTLDIVPSYQHEVVWLKTRTMQKRWPK